MWNHVYQVEGTSIWALILKWVEVLLLKVFGDGAIQDLGWSSEEWFFILCSNWDDDIELVIEWEKKKLRKMNLSRWVLPRCWWVEAYLQLMRGWESNSMPIYLTQNLYLMHMVTKRDLRFCLQFIGRFGALCFIRFFFFFSGVLSRLFGWPGLKWVSLVKSYGLFVLRNFWLEISNAGVRSHF